MAKYYPTPEQTAECGCCGHRANGADFIRNDDDADGGEYSECRECGVEEESVPYLDEEDIARDAEETT